MFRNNVDMEKEFEKYMSLCEEMFQETDIEVIRTEQRPPGASNLGRWIMVKNNNGRELMLHFYLKDNLIVDSMIVIATTFPDSKNKIVSGEGKTHVFNLFPNYQFKRILKKTIKDFKYLKM